MIKYPFLALCAFMLSACACGGKISDIDVGMSKQEIISKMGTPDKSYQDGEMEVLTYMNKRQKSWSLNKYDYRIVLINDTTAQIGPEIAKNAG
ncbi:MULTISPECIES: DUF3192 domain-containing protein [Tenebrionibacter/Tenebrionicola group]|jgi:hypothetical protein|uniref:Uncharacterized protein n=2 Tax=Tenebrionibacter/Tenebrionicola group TaxID=2969848 RepID=A0A8K0Y0S2_9ENTR|nr:MULTISPECIES: DUF3192 domain-containing protein [Tenebrionibacter/Tenebrionicola group]MBK4716914.1 hypothetical protein [Tenebrionibacter intestinalis]MBV4412095.1 hypothetical protein [Tenebrionicola larvae]MBV5096872.1 hypothetical protein [Tenebrionicola larvae]